MLIVVFHFIIENMQQQILLLALKKIKKQYFDENMNHIVFQTLDEYEIRNNLNYFVKNNVNSNDIMFKHISNIFRKQHDIDYDFVEHRLRCLNHIINLTMQIYLFEKHFVVKYRIVVNTFFVKKLNDNLQKYRKFEFQNKFHNINTYILYFSQRVQRFLKFEKNFNNVMFKRNQFTK